MSSAAFRNGSNAVDVWPHAQRVTSLPRQPAKKNVHEARGLRVRADAIRRWSCRRRLPAHAWASYEALPQSYLRMATLAGRCAE